MTVVGTKPRRKLAIEHQSKIDKEFSKKSAYRHRPSVKVVVIKWVSTAILGALLLACVTDSKISIIALSNKMNKDIEDKSEHAFKGFVILQLLAVIPNVINFIRGVWTGAFRKDLPWPRKKALIAVNSFINFHQVFKQIVCTMYFDCNLFDCKRQIIKSFFLQN